MLQEDPSSLRKARLRDGLSHHQSFRWFPVLSESSVRIPKHLQWKNHIFSWGLQLYLSARSQGPSLQAKSWDFPWYSAILRTNPEACSRCRWILRKLTKVHRNRRKFPPKNEDTCQARPLPKGILQKGLRMFFRCFRKFSRCFGGEKCVSQVLRLHPA